MKYEIQNDLVLSASHITMDEWDWLYACCRQAGDRQYLVGEAPIVDVVGDYGDGSGTVNGTWGFRINLHSTYVEIEGYQGAHPNVMKLWKLGRDMGCTHLIIDRDGQQRQDLPQFEGNNPVV